jgi:hypothetical protein
LVRSSARNVFALLALHRRTEFAGIPEETQRQWIRDASRGQPSGMPAAMTSRVPGTSVATAGKAQAAASSRPIGRPSQREERTNPCWREGFPNAVLEAEATGIPVITTQCTGSYDAVLPEVTGLLIPPGYPEAIRDAVLKLLRDPVRRQRMGAAARAWVLRHYAHERVLGLVAMFYRNLLQPAAAASPLTIRQLLDDDSVRHAVGAGQ